MATVANPYTGLNSLCKMSEIHEIGAVRHQIYQQIIFCGQLAGINLDSWTLDKVAAILDMEISKCNVISGYATCRK
jgi:hypothetical protein